MNASLASDKLDFSDLSTAEKNIIYINNVLISAACQVILRKVHSVIISG